ncbi:MAG: CrcB family protein, partial [Spirulinaceae cyanobacterium RM2_2_10]|nr:CrcB family protein [Spirulinaceae cyanobacterium RM2_2_10]
LWLTQRLGNGFPYGTFVVNLSGSFALGFLTLVLAKMRPVPMDLVWLVAIGGLGSYTTFATYELDSYRLCLDRRWLVLSAYWLGSPLLGLLGLYAGTLTARLFR